MSNVTALPTIYRGVEFRSRTEARWARYFDALGWRWEFEAQGFELDDGSRYLPDFWLPDQGAWVECKGSHRWKKPLKVYCAGKVWAGVERDTVDFRLRSPPAEWRLGFGADVGHEQGGLCSIYEYERPHQRMIAGLCAEYYGPWLANDTHGSFVMSEYHGADASVHNESASLFDAQVRIFLRCRRSIGEADVFMAYIDHPKCYGTLVEIGDAASLDRAPAMHIAFSESMKSEANDFWFARLFAASSTATESQFHDSWRLHVTDYPEEWVRETLIGMGAQLDGDMAKSDRFLNRPGVKGAIVCGPPGRDRSLYSYGGFDLPGDVAAISAAQSERFGT